MVDLVGIEPTTSSMPWNYQGCRSLILKQLMAGQAGKTGINGAFCYQIATKPNEWDKGLIRGGSALYIDGESFLSRENPRP